MQIQKGKIAKPVHAVIYGTEGIGKTTIASKFPRPLIIDAEGGSFNLEVDRVTPKSYLEVMPIVAELKQSAQGYQTLVIDTADWLEKMLTEQICITNKMASIETMSYGKGWVMVSELWKKLLDEVNLLSEKQNMHILFLAHSMIRHVDPPDAPGYDRYELKLSKQGNGILKEWPDLLLFATYELFKVKQADGKEKVGGGRRIMFASHHPTFDAKNRFGLPDQMDFDFAKIAHLFTSPVTSAAATSPAAPVPAAPPAASPSGSAAPSVSSVSSVVSSAPAPAPAAQPQAPAVPPPPAAGPDEKAQAAQLLEKIKSLCKMNQIRVEELQIDVASQGWAARDQKPSTYNARVLQGIVAKWQQILFRIKARRGEFAS
jgi:hypothetical protein